MKNEYGGWISSIPEITQEGVYTLNPLTSASNNCYKIKSPYNSNEFFIVEYRKQSGNYEGTIEGNGLVVYRINPVGDNYNGPNDEVYIYRPNGTLVVNGMAYDAHFSSQVGRTSINDNTNPNSFLCDGSAGGLRISNVSSAGTTISFKVDFVYEVIGDDYVCPNTEVTFTVNNAPTSYTWNHSTNLVPVVGNPGTFTTSFFKGDAWVSISVNEVESERKEFVIGSEVTGIDQISYAGKNRYYVSPACAGELNNIWILEWQGMDLLVDKPDTVYGRNYVDVVSTTNPNNLTIATLTLKQGGYTYTKQISVMGVDVGLEGIHLPDPFDPVLTFSPNPTVGETTISIEQGSANDTSLKSASAETTFDENAEWDLEVYDSMLSLKLKEQKLKGKSITINTQSWKEGIYMVRVKYKDDIITGKLVVKK